jgi:hypothetical protein
MFVLEFERVEIDYCYQCGGVWLDSGELELIAGRAGALEASLLQALEQGTGQRVSAGPGRRCPVCRRRLVQVTAQTEPPIVLDRCPSEHGLWFDRGELSGVVRAAGAEKDNALARFLAGLAPGGSPQGQ